MIVLVAWLLADFLSGLAHWFEDRVLIEPKGPKFLKSIAVDNDIHHVRPTELLKCTLWENMNTSAAVAWPAAILLLLIGAPKVVCLAVFFASFGNVVHRFSHEPPGRVPKAIRILQMTGLFISRFQHGEHHFVNRKLVAKDKSIGRYCVMTSWLNPILDWFGFFEALSFIFAKGER